MQIAPIDLAAFGVSGYGEWEILILSIVLILFGARKLPELARGLGKGIDAFWGSGRGVIRDLDDEASDAGRSLGGIYGKPAAQPITPDNRVAELYDPAVFGERKFRVHRKKKSKILQVIRLLWETLLKPQQFRTEQEETEETESSEGQSKDLMA